MGELELDRRRRSVRVGGLSLNLSAREFSLLDYLLRHPGQVLTSHPDRRGGLGP